VALTDDHPVDWDPVWSPDGKYLYFSSDRGGVLNLWRLPIDARRGRATGDPVPITTPNHWVGGIAIAGDGRRIAYEARESRTHVEQVSFDLARRKVVGSPQTVFQGSRVLRDICPSPDGEWVAMALTGTQEDIYVMRRDGSDFRQLTDDPAKDRGVGWTPDGKLLFYSNRSGTYETWTIRRDGSDLQALTDLPEQGTWYPRLSPDGTRLVFHNSEGGQWLDLRNGPGERELFQLPRPSEAGGKLVPTSWSPDGSSILVEVEGGGVFVYRIETGEYRQLSESGRNSAWVPGSSVVLFRKDDELWAVDSLSGASDRVDTGNLDLSQVDVVHIDAGKGNLIYIVRQNEADIWMAELE
jgi:Tol biopolymer transport system component